MSNAAGDELQSLSKAELIEEIARLRAAAASLNPAPGQAASVDADPALFRQMVDHIQNLAWIADANGSIQYYNQRWYDYTGTTPEQMAGWGWQSVHDPEQLPRVLDRWKASIASGQPVDLEFPLRRADGQYRLFLTRVEPYRDSSGRIVNWFGTNTDIHDQKAAEASFRQLADAMPQIVWAAGPDGLLDYYNRRWYDFIGQPESAGPRSDLVRWEQYVHPDDLARAGISWASSLQTGNPYAIEFRVRDGARAYHWFLVRALPVRNDAGEIDRWFGTCTDIDDQKAAADELREGREQLTLAIDAAQLGTWQVDLATLAMTCSEACKANYGRAGAPFTYAMLWECVHPEDRVAAEEAVRRAIDERVEYAADYRIFWPDGSLHWAAARGRTTYADDGTPLRISGVNQDITARKQAETDREQLLAAERAARVEAEHAGRMKDEFLATLSHELRTPLNAIVGWTQILKSSSADPEDLRDGLAVIDRNARAQTQIIEDILDMSRIVSGKLRLDVQRIELAALVRASADTVQPAADAKGIRLHVLLDPSAGPVSGDPNRLQQVFWNLLSNAIKFTPKDGRVQVLLERVNSHVEVSVIDNGEGIGAAFLPHVFDRFRQADASTTRKHGGLGLGLAIVKQLVELHGGSVRVKSPGAGQGATFIVTLPLTVIHAEPDVPSTPREHPETEIPDGLYRLDCDHLNGVSVLVVDDEPDARNMMMRLLTECGAVVRSAGSANDAMACICEQVPAVLISDIGMPGEDGYTLIGRVRQLPLEAGGQIHALALTAYARASDRVRALEAGFQMHLSKPFEPTELIAMVASLARRPKPSP